MRDRQNFLIISASHPLMKTNWVVTSLSARSISKDSTLKGTVSRDFRLLVFFMNQLPPSPWGYHQCCFEFFRKFAEIFAVQGAPPVSLTPVARIFNHKSFNYFVGHLWEIELTYRYIFAFQFSLRSQKPDIVPIICHRYRWYRWCTLTC